MFTLLRPFPLVLLLVMETAVRLPAAPAFPLHTAGPYLVDAQGHRVRLNAVSWYGAESTDFVVGGLQADTLGHLVQQIQKAGFNAVRLPWSNQLYESNPVVGSSVLAANPALIGQSALSILDQVVSALANAGLMVILDNHNSQAEWCCGNDGNELWYNSAYPETNWLNDWKGLVARYQNQPSVIGADLRNEPRGSATWGGAAGTDWHAAAERGGNAVLSVNPHLLIFVEGVNYALDLSGAATLPVTLNTAQRVVYSAHDYGFDYAGLTGYADWISQIMPRWGYLITGNNPQPFWLGEFGTCNTANTCVSSASNSDLGDWFQFLTTYLTQYSVDWSYWAVNGTQSSGRTYGAAESYGVLNTSWNASASPALTARLQALETSTGGPADGTYRIVNANSSLAMDVTGQSTANGAVIEQWAYWGGANQTWSLKNLGQGAYEITNTGSSLALDVTHQSTAAGGGLEQWSEWGGGNQQFVIRPGGSGFYQIVNTGSGWAVEVPSFSPVNGTALDQWPLNGGTNQQWSLTAP